MEVCVLRQATARLRHALESEPNNVPLLDLLGSSYFETEGFAHATESLAKALTLDPRSHGAS